MIGLFSRPPRSRGARRRSFSHPSVSDNGRDRSVWDVPDRPPPPVHA
ncbi:MAG: hypothetical protein AVDCRST_MAG87-2581 [uncultured Thermomicrobiales bacterium]|uniref:Uncharacterized protein n=1 Tax=uncultured Thermomicrobiales bacterium TaxID=1645740 RepID=A0A6J4VD19_9BACT|nr:MAG: hypothetical protein AVDCRST_MAG87-2581 [uncultured Thermomicrobiales bacterium]